MLSDTRSILSQLNLYPFVPWHGGLIPDTRGWTLLNVIEILKKKKPMTDKLKQTINELKAYYKKIYG